MTVRLTFAMVQSITIVVALDDESSIFRFELATMESHGIFTDNSEYRARNR